MGIFSRIFGSSSKRVIRRDDLGRRTLGHRGVGAKTPSKLAPIEDWHVLSGDDVDEFVHFEQPLYVQSSNVAMAQYFGGEEKMMVEFLGGHAYIYSGVSEQEARQFAVANSKGKWVWDYLRVRGSRTEHKKKYQRLR